MEYRQFGRTDLKVSAIGFGCWEIGGTYGRIDEGEFQRAVARAIDVGVTCFDTAEAYGVGVSEEALARALGGRRNDVVIATKFGVGYEEMPNRRDSSRARVLASIDKSLRRLRTDHVEIYLVHWPDPNTPLDETMAALDESDWRSKSGNLGSLNLFRTLFGPEHFQRNLAAVEELRPLAAKYGKTLPQFALRWTLSNPVAGTALVGFRAPSEVSENLGALGWEISGPDMEEVDAILARNGAVTVPPGWLED